MLPEPTGRYKIGTSIFHLVDTGRIDFVTKQSGQFNELMIQIWYPADVSGNASSATARYIPDNEEIQEMLRQSFASEAVIKNLAMVKTHSVLDAPVVKNKGRFPLLLASPGWGSPRFALTSLAEDLASHGYIVVGIDHPYNFTILPDGRIQTVSQDKDADDTEAYNVSRTESWAKDASFVLSGITNRNNRMLEKFARQIDPEQVGMFGHSMGGAVALEAARVDSRFKAIIDLDGVPFGKVVTEGFNRPTAIMASQMEYSDEDLAKRGRTREQMAERGKQRKALWAGIFSKSKNDAYWIAVNGTNHSHFTDTPFTMPDLIAQFGGKIIDPNRGFKIITTYMREFFDRYLQDKRSELTGISPTLYPEVSLRREP